MTLDNFQYPAQSRMTRACVATAAALAFALCVFSRPAAAEDPSIHPSKLRSRKPPRRSSERCRGG